MRDTNSFLPEDYLEKKVARRTNFICLSLFAVVMCGVVAAWFVTDQQRTNVRELQQQVNNQFEEAARRVEQLEELHERKREMIRKAKVTSTLVERVPRTLVLSELINHMPATLSLVSFDLETKTLRSTPRPRTSLDRANAAKQKKLRKKKGEPEPEAEIVPTQVNIELVGLAPTDLEVSEFISRISRHEMFADVTLQFSEQQKVESQLMRKFRVTMQLNQRIDIHDVQPTLVQRGKPGLKQDPMGGRVTFDQGNLVPTTASVPTE